MTTKTIRIDNNMGQVMQVIPIKGYQWYLDGQLVCWSETFFTTDEEVCEEMQMRVKQICQEIYDNSKDNPFTWDDYFDPNDPDSCDDFEECLENYNRIQYMVSDDGCQKIYENVKDAENPLENKCPYEISWHIMPYKVKIPAHGN